MKRALLTLFVMIFFLSVSQAQVRNDLKGPKAKNYKPWKDPARSTQILVSQEPLDLTGPEAKNYKPWEEQARSQNLVDASTSPRTKLQGPRAKNYKPWRNQSSSKYFASDEISDEVSDEATSTDFHVRKPKLGNE